MHANVIGGTVNGTAGLAKGTVSGAVGIVGLIIGTFKLILMLGAAMLVLVAGAGIILYVLLCGHPRGIVRRAQTATRMIGEVLSNGTARSALTPNSVKQSSSRPQPTTRPESMTDFIKRH